MSNRTVDCSKNKGDTIRLAVICLKRLPEINLGVRKADLTADIRQHLKHLLALAEEKNIIGHLVQYYFPGGLVERADKSKYSLLERSAIYRTGNPFQKNGRTQRTN
jgi:hypothetical protein